MIDNFPKAPDGLCFEVRDIGLGWISVALKTRKNYHTIITDIVPRPNMSLFNIPGRFTSDLSEIRDYEVTQEKEIINTANSILKKYDNLMASDDEYTNVIKKIRKVNKENYIGRY